MSRRIVHARVNTEDSRAAAAFSTKGQPTVDMTELNIDAGATKDSFLVALGERIRTVRARRGLTRKETALAADVSERHLANLELGTGNASILVLNQVAQALQCSLAELLGD